MKGALSSKPNYQFDAEGNLAKAEVDETDEVTFLRESIVLFVEGQSANHPADVAASNAPADVIPEAALNVKGTRRVLSEIELEEQPGYGRPLGDDETHHDVATDDGMPATKRGRKSKW